MNEIHSNKADLEANITEWKKTKAVIDKKLPRWILLEKLKGYTSHLQESVDFDAPISTIRAERNLLDPSDPVEPLIGQMVQLLRERLNELQTQLKETHLREQRKLESNDSWKKLNEEQRLTIAQRNLLLEPKKIKVGNEEDILDTLEEGTLEYRRTQIDAIPQRFTMAIEDAAKLLEPKASRVTLPSATIKNEAELDKWVENVRRRVKEQLKEGPVIL